jgi:hypothetical protein
MKILHSLLANVSRACVTTLAVLVTGTVLQAQAPAAAVAAFQKSQPGVTPQWTIGPGGSHEAQFMRDGNSQVYAYDAAGVLQSKKIKSAMTTLPTTVQRSIDAGYAGGKVEAAYKVVTRNQEKYYEVQVAQAGQRERLRYNLEGQPIGKTSLAASAAPVAVAKPAPAPVAVVKPSPAPVAVAKPAPAPVAVAKPTPAPTIASAARPTPAPVAKPMPPKPAPTTMAMRGESAPAPASQDDDMDDLMDDEEFDDLLDSEDEDLDDVEDDDLLDEDEDEDWEDIDDDDLN